MAGINALGATKGEGSVIDGIERLQEFDIFIHEKSENAIREFKTYKWIKDELTGKFLNEPEDCNNHCFVGNTLIETIIGGKQIKDITQKDFVNTSIGYRRVLKLFNNGLKQVYKYSIQFDTFSLSLTCTKNHLIKTNQGWIQISKLKSGMMVYLAKNLTAKFSGCIRKNDIFQEGQQECTSKFGSSTIKKFLKDITFIIKIRIHGIMIFRIWNLLKEANIKANMAEKDLKKILNGSKNFTQQESQKLQNGIDQKKEKNGIRNKEWKLGLKENLKHLFVRNAVKNIKQDTQEYQNFVMLTVKHVHCEKEEKQNVYDLMIDEQHEYFANGLLVHNCIDPVRYGIRFYRRSVRPM